MVVAKQLQPTMATSNPALSTTNLLHELDAAAQEVMGKVAAAQVCTLEVPLWHFAIASNIAHWHARWRFVA
jgi:hypothetical protein